MVRRKQRRKKLVQGEEDPMAGTANLVDAMLVIALGFLVFIVISWNMQGVIFSDMDQEQREAIMEAISEVAEVTQGEQLDSTPDISDESGNGYTEMGTVYKDPKTGKLIMVEN